jgi:hypothetical protein
MHRAVIQRVDHDIKVAMLKIIFGKTAESKTRRKRKCDDEGRTQRS